MTSVQLPGPGQPTETRLGSPGCSQPGLAATKRKQTSPRWHSSPSKTLMRSESHLSTNGTHSSSHCTKGRRRLHTEHLHLPCTLLHYCTSANKRILQGGTEGTRHMLVFAGVLFDTDNEHKRLKNVLTGLSFRHQQNHVVRLAGLEHGLHFTALDSKIYMRSYKVLLKKSGCRTPRIELEEMGPAFDFVLRTHMASDDLYRTAHRQPKGLKPKKKNISNDAFGSRFGRLHMQRQNLDKLQTRKMKGLKKRRGHGRDHITQKKMNKTN
ncbi:ribosome production factor 2 homolog [Myxocyprinus asiaticus]|uniref:ribosome production factor 2 homolog n=1 Tax=Myxocyprinus asiaticus TaxID=70543 RepID=UPI002223A255|nr:ribosome production factor 2 homolog [Myxocyprinus asiaticus]